MSRIDGVEVRGITPQGRRVLWVAEHLADASVRVRIGYRLHSIGWGLPDPLWWLTRPLRRLGLRLMGDGELAG